MARVLLYSLLEHMNSTTAAEQLDEQRIKSIR